MTESTVEIYCYLRFFKSLFEDLGNRDANEPVPVFGKFYTNRTSPYFVSALHLCLEKSFFFYPKYQHYFWCDDLVKKHEFGILIWYSAWNHLSFFEEEKTSTMLELVSEIFVSKWWNLIRFIFHWNRPIRRRSKKKTGQSETKYFNFTITLFLFAEAVKVRPIVV